MEMQTSHPISKVERFRSKIRSIVQSHPESFNPSDLPKSSKTDQSPTKSAAVTTCQSHIFRARKMRPCYTNTTAQNRLQRAQFSSAQIKVKTVGVTTLLARGWNRKLILQHLGKPDASGSKRRLWLIDRVLELERTISEIQRRLII